MMEELNREIESPVGPIFDIEEVQNAYASSSHEFHSFNELAGPAPNITTSVGGQGSVQTNSSYSTVTLSNELVVDETPERIRIRRRKNWNKANWDKEKQRAKRIRGETYIGTVTEMQNGKVKIRKVRKESKTIGRACTSGHCKKSTLRKCQSFSAEARDQIFKAFWENDSWGKKQDYVNGFVDRTVKKFSRKVEITIKPRSFSYSYHLPLNGLKTPVCKAMFMSTLGIKKHQLYNWITADQPKAFRPRPPKPNPVERKARSFLRSLPKLPSHYCRSTTGFQYFEGPFRSKSDVYRAYKVRQLRKRCLFFSQRRFMYTLDNLKYKVHRPKKDACNLCSAHKVGNLAQEEYEAHIVKKVNARIEKFNDKKAALQQQCNAICMDLQAVKFAPVVNSNAYYFKTKLAVHNFTVYDMKSKKVICYIWDQTEGGLTASVFASCIWNFMQTQISSNMPIIIYSDGCGYQNRNVTLANTILQYSVLKKQVIIQKFLERGHTQMEVDSVHANIERELRGKEIHIPLDYVKICEQARCSPFPYKVKFLSHDFFKDFGDLTYQRYTSIRPPTSNGPRKNVTDIRQLKYNPNGTIEYKLDHSSGWALLPPASVKETDKLLPSNLYTERLPVSQRKFKDLQDLLRYIPAEYHNFYKSLPVEKE